MLVERVDLGTLQVEDADATVLHEQRDHQLRSHVVHDLDVARVLRDVRHQHRFLVSGRVPDQPSSQPHLRERGPFAVPHGELHLEIAGLLVEEHDPERAVVHQAADERGETGEQFVEVEDRGHLAADLGQRFERLAVLALALEETGVLDRHRHRRRELPEQRSRRSR